MPGVQHETGPAILQHDAVLRLDEPPIPSSRTSSESSSRSRPADPRQSNRPCRRPRSREFRRSAHRTRHHASGRTPSDETRAPSGTRDRAGDRPALRHRRIGDPSIAIGKPEAAGRSARAGTRRCGRDLSDRTTPQARHLELRHALAVGRLRVHTASSAKLDRQRLHPLDTVEKAKGLKHRSADRASNHARPGAKRAQL